jgi:hypothetical protein
MAWTFMGVSLGNHRQVAKSPAEVNVWRFLADRDDECVTATLAGLADVEY